MLTLTQDVFEAYQGGGLYETQKIAIKFATEDHGDLVQCKCCEKFFPINELAKGDH
jgi:hypothetical protein